MSLRSCLARLPGEYERVEDPRGVLAVHRDFREALLDAGFAPAGEPVIESSDLAGRRRLGQVDTPAGRLVVRRFHHGGLLRWLSGDRFADPARPFHELHLLAELRRRGVAAPLGVAARARRARGLGWRLSLVTRRVEHALDVEQLFDRLRGSQALEAIAPRLFRTLGAFVGRVHRVGFVHVDLTPRNILVAESLLEPEPGAPPPSASPPGDPERGPVWLLDLDRCRFQDDLSRHERLKLLGRLLRFLLRREPAPGSGRPSVLTRARLGHFLRAYQEAVGEPVSWKQDWRWLVGEVRRSSALHRLGWAIEELFGARADRGWHRA